MALDLFNDDICLSRYIGCPIDSTSLISISHLLMSYLQAQLHVYIIVITIQNKDSSSQFFNLNS